MPIRGLKGGQLKLFSSDEIYCMHMAVCEVMERIGVKVETERMLKVFDDAGCGVDKERKIVKIPQYLLMEYIAKAPKKVYLAGRSKDYDIILEDDRIVFGMGGSPKSKILDFEKKEHRIPKKKDVEDTTRLADALPTISFIQNIANSAEYPPQVQLLHNLDAVLRNTQKHYVCSVANVKQARYAIKMASLVVNDLAKRPLISIYTDPASPLMLTSSQESAIEAAEKNVPIVMCTAPQAGTTSPVTLAGAIVQNLCENLAVLCLAQLVKKGIAVVLGATPTIMDPRTSMFCLGAPEFMLQQIGACQLSHYYNLPYFGGGCCSDSKLPDAQAGVEASMTALTSALAGINMIQDVGVFAFDDSGCMELLVIGDEIIRMIERILKGICVDEDSLAIDVIENVGPSGHFLSQKHTLNHLSREIYIPKLFDRKPESIWQREGSKDIGQVAHEKAKRILSEHKPEPLPKNVEQKLKELLKEAEKDLIR
jgi:trimethylamine--corrinoid protein Co-methyltransferase